MFYKHHSSFLLALSHLKLDLIIISPSCISLLQLNIYHKTRAFHYDVTGRGLDTACQFDFDQFSVYFFLNQIIR